MTRRAAHLARMRRRGIPRWFRLLKTAVIGVDCGVGSDYSVTFTWRDGNWVIS